MFKRLLSVFTLLSLLIISSASAQADDNPAIAILRFGGSSLAPTVTEISILDSLHAYGYINAEEKSIMEGRTNLAGENITITWGDATWDLPTANLMIDAALDRDVDVLVTLTTPVTQIAVNATLALETPPAVLFASVYNPYRAGIAQSSCIKPDHVTGTELQSSYADILALLRMQAPDISTIGTLYNSSETSGIIGAERITELSESLGLTVIHTAVTDLSDLRAATDSLVSKGAEAIVLPIDSVTAQGLPTIATVANDNGILIFYPSIGSISHGATIGAGFHRYEEQGHSIGRMLTAYLDGNLDTATTGIDVQTGSGIGVNLDSAKLLGIEIADAVLAQVDIVIDGGHVSQSSAFQALTESGRATAAMADRLAHDLAYLQNLHCSPDNIAEQQAALDAADS